MILYIQSILTLIGINILLALSFYLSFSAGMISLAQAGFMGIGAYTSSVLTTKVGLPFLPALIAGGITSGIMGVIVGFPALRIKGIYLLLMTLGFGETVRIFFLNFEYTGGAYGLGGIKQETNICNLYVLILLLVIFFLRISRSRIGRAFEAIREDEEAAEGMGINLTRNKIFAFAMGASIAGIGGGFYAHYAQFIDPGSFGIPQALEIMIFSIFGASILTILPEWLRPLKEWRLFFYGFILLSMMILRPRGVIDKHLVGLLAYKRKSNKQVRN